MTSLETEHKTLLPLPSKESLKDTMTFRT